jgi:uncharacterized membrane protein
MENLFVRRKTNNLILVFLLLLLFGINTALASSPVVRAVFFYSPTCGHCHKVITEDLLPLIDQYSEQLIILGVDVSTPEGQQLYLSTHQHYQVPEEKRGVPLLIIGDIYLVGSIEIPQQLPELIEAGLAAGGVVWPSIPGLSEIIERELPPEVESNEYTFKDRFNQDVTGNSLAVVVLVGMIASVLVAGYGFLKDFDMSAYSWTTWVIPVLALIGIGVAAYLSYVEVSHTEAVCGPVGDCNSVQQSPYAYLFGFVPVGILGTIGYTLILIIWMIQRFLTGSIKNLANIIIWGIAWLGVIFSIYLTFLEPFVIGATCSWCITSAILMTLILLASTPFAKNAMYSTDDLADSDHVHA